MHMHCCLHRHKHRKKRTRTCLCRFLLAALDALLHEGEGALRKLRAGLNDTLCRFLAATAEVSIGVPPSEGDSLLAPFSALTECGLRLETCLGLLGSSWRSGVGASLGRCELTGHQGAVRRPYGDQEPEAYEEIWAWM